MGRLGIPRRHVLHLPLPARQKNTRMRGGAMTAPTLTEAPAGLPAESAIIFENVSKFYGDVLGVNRVHLSIPPGVTSLVGPNGSGKTTLMNLLCGLIAPTQGS